MDNMNWNIPDLTPEPEREEGKHLTGLLIGAAMAAVTLVLITALILTTVGYLLWPEKEDVYNPYAPQELSEADLVNANYRPSTWTQPAPAQIVTATPIPDEVIIEADAEYTLLTNIYERVNPSVVNIEVVSGAYSNIDIFDSSGSGFVLDTQGHIATNAHVVRDAEEIMVTFYDGYVASAEIIGIDDYSDLAVIRINPSGAPLSPVTLGDSNGLVVGQRVVAIGNPFGLEGSMTVGIVSALGRSLPSAQLLDPAYAGYSNPSIIQVDAAVNPGNSGGPLLNSYGEVIGINTAIRTENGGFQGVAFAVPVNTMKRVIPQLIEKGEAEYPWLGITSISASDQGLSMAVLAEELDLPVRNGVLISDVIRDSPAARAGLQGGTVLQRVRGIDIPVDGDIVVAINGNMVRDIDDLVAYLVENTSPDDTVVLTILRDGQTLDLDVELGVRP
ncbi:MAG: trypsin-like peptidase domain-containing protein [Anaerolineae bacterium]|jgi:2-alkenal reductase|nr:trypsin-like peptidase domain-containing protein [Anaerolineae bacterium]